jgi:hypothetical protein
MVRACCAGLQQIIASLEEVSRVIARKALVFLVK